MNDLDDHISRLRALASRDSELPEEDRASIIAVLVALSDADRELAEVEAEEAPGFCYSLSEDAEFGDELATREDALVAGRQLAVEQGRDRVYTGRWVEADLYSLVPDADWLGEAVVEQMSALAVDEYDDESGWPDVPDEYVLELGQLMRRIVVLWARARVESTPFFDVDEVEEHAVDGEAESALAEGEDDDLDDDGLGADEPGSL